MKKVFIMWFMQLNLIRVTVLYLEKFNGCIIMHIRITSTPEAPYLVWFWLPAADTSFARQELLVQGCMSLVQ